MSEDAGSEMPWRERVGLALAIEDELGAEWVGLDGEDFNESVKLIGVLTAELGTNWVPVLCYYGRAERPVSVTEIADALSLDPGDVSACLIRLEEEKLVEATAQPGTYVFVPRRGKKL